MWQLGEDNWIKYGWGETLSKDWKPGDTFYVDLRKHVFPDPDSNVADNAKIAVNNIIKSYPPPYTLMCSGGTDSQAMIWAWYTAKVKFNIVSIRYISEGIFFNEHDLVSLNEFAKKLNLTVEYKDFDVITFLENDLSTYANIYDCSSPQICIHMKMSELIETGTILFAGNHLYFKSKMVGFNYTLLGLSRYSDQISTVNRTIIPFFLMHNSKLAISFANAEKKILVHDKHVKHKDKNYLNVGIPLSIPKDKFTGFEKIKEYYDKYNDRVSNKDRIRFIKKPSTRVFDLLFRYPYEKAGKMAKLGPEIHLF